MYRASAIAVLAVSLLALTVADAAAEEGSRFREAVRSDGGVVASESPAATRACLEVLDAGGNAVDRRSPRPSP